MTNPVAYLYGRDRAPIGAAGVAVAPDLVVFSPWPADLGAGAAFRVRVVAGDGIAEWHQPLGVDYARLAGARETTNVALVTLLDPLRQPVEVLRGSRSMPWSPRCAPRARGPP
ncbi:MAG: hypothetical protein R2731_17205 [Nocardioides sp.]